MNLLITGGAGFIGSKLAARAAAEGATVTVLDNLSPQVHGNNGEFSERLLTVATCVLGDVADRSILERLIPGQDAIVHLAAETGTGQSMYAIERYEQVNIHGTAVLLDLIVERRPPSLRKLLVASSRAIYGEGRYTCAKDGHVYPAARQAVLMAAGRFDPACPTCGGQIKPTTTPEAAPLTPSSFYGLTKQVQEQMVLMFANTLGIDSFALRFQNVYGPGQSLKNPYTGLLAVFSNQVRRGKALNIFEDGMESRDFIYVDDAVDATIRCLGEESRGVAALNVGSGNRTSVLEVAQSIVAMLGTSVPIEVSGQFRIGDIRHNVADIAAVQSLTGFVPRWSFSAGLQEFLRWAVLQNNDGAPFEGSMEELDRRGLLGKANRLA